MVRIKKETWGELIGSLNPKHQIVTGILVEVNGPALRRRLQHKGVPIHLDVKNGIQSRRIELEQTSAPVEKHTSPARTCT